MRKKNAETLKSVMALYLWRQGHEQICTRAGQLAGEEGQRAAATCAAVGSEQLAGFRSPPFCALCKIKVDEKKLFNISQVNVQIGKCR